MFIIYFNIIPDLCGQLPSILCVNTCIVRVFYYPANNVELCLLTQLGVTRRLILLDFFIEYSVFNSLAVTLTRLCL